VIKIINRAINAIKKINLSTALVTFLLCAIRTVEELLCRVLIRGREIRRVLITDNET